MFLRQAKKDGGSHIVKLLLIHSDEKRSDLIARQLRSFSLDVDSVFDGVDGYHYLISGLYDMVILGSNLTSMSRSEIETLLQKEQLSISIITDDGDNIAELLQKVQAMVASKMLDHPTNLSYLDLSLDPSKHVLACNNQTVLLTPRETDILQYLLQQPGSYVSKQELCEHLWQENTPTIQARLEVHLSLLRAKLKQLGTKTIIQTKRNTGYRMQ